jgi:heme/copper-type cytochrome/quinol oxidase subunit 3
MTTLAAARIDTRQPSRPVSWWGVMLLIATEGTIFVALLAAYFFVRSTSDEWPQGSIEPPALGRTGVFTVILLASSVPLFVAEAAIRRDRLRVLRLAFAANFGLGAAFFVNQALEYRDLHFGLADNAYASLFYVITGLHGIHVLVGLLMNLVVQLKARRNTFDPTHHQTVSVFSLYWHFVDVVWIFVFSALYLSAHVT